MARRGTKGTTAGTPAFIIPLDRDVSPEERARLILWLKSPDTQLALRAMQQLRPKNNLLAWRVPVHPQISQNFESMLQGWDLAVETLQAVSSPGKRQVELAPEFTPSQDEDKL